MTSSSSLWLTRRDAAALLGVSVRTVADLKHELKKGATRGKGATLRLHAPAVVEIWVAKQIEQAVAQLKPVGGDDGDPLMVGTAKDSPGLERYRLGKAQMVEMDLDERRAVMVRRDALMNAIGPALKSMRAAGDLLTRQFGNDAGEIYNQAVADFAHGFSQALGRFGAKNDGGGKTLTAAR